ncbi:hypothetical protein FVQ98_16615 [Ottowia sp. GY511]|uniref:DUF2782 domain-containing protein n=1 Tax=Ottowia flava TaxID=2675430 RepID=A0ABW4KS80_9BURK|nr:hypothetical protein [Ottowia sp. GY511]TXK23551.1 hypothetical protein FVQ98_16615 [Ottowia sp. GY511]
MRATVHFRASLATLALLGAIGVNAQAPAPAAPASAGAAGAEVSRDELRLDRRTQRVEHIRTEDAGSRVDEVRSGGETKSITVQPKTNVPPYSVQPADPTNMGSGEAGPGAPGRRVWKIQF